LCASEAEDLKRSLTLTAKTAAVVNDNIAQFEPTLLTRIRSSLEDDKAEELVTIDLSGRSALTDALVVATGRSARHVTSLAENLARRLKEWGYGSSRIEGLSQGDWVLVDAGDVVVHIFRAEVRSYYDLEGMWSVDETAQRQNQIPARFSLHA
jgi:ribosome-associated protein